MVYTIQEKREYIKYLFDILYKSCFPATVATETHRKGRCEYRLGPEVFREHTWAGGHAVTSGGLHCRRACPRTRSYEQRCPGAPRNARARRDRPAERGGEAPLLALTFSRRCSHRMELRRMRIPKLSEMGYEQRSRCAFGRYLEDYTGRKVASQ